MNISDGNGILGHFSESSILIIRKLSGYVTVFVKYNFCVLSFSFYAQVYLVYMMKTPITLEFRQVLIRFNHPFVSENKVLTFEVIIFFWVRFLKLRLKQDTSPHGQRSCEHILIKQDFIFSDFFHEKVTIFSEIYKVNAFQCRLYQASLNMCF